MIKIGDTECHIELIIPSTILTPVYKKELINRRYIDFDIFTNIRDYIIGNSVKILGKLDFYTQAAKLFSQLQKA